LSLRLLVDEDSQSRRLVARLRAAGHDVLTVNEAELQGTVDAVVLERAHLERRAVLTRNVWDFRDLHRSGASHSGILGVFFDRDPGKDLSDAEVIRAIANLEEAEVTIHGEFHALNAWHWRDADTT